MSDYELTAQYAWNILTLLLVTWQTDLNNSGHTLDIDTSSGNIGTEENALLGLPELFGRLSSRRLRHPGVDLPCWIGKVHVGEDLVEYASRSSSG